MLSFNSPGKTEDNYRLFIQDILWSGRDSIKQIHSVNITALPTPTL